MSGPLLDRAAQRGLLERFVRARPSALAIDPDNAERLDLLELTMSFLLRIYEPETAEKWLFGSNPRLRNRRPIDVIRAGETQELLPVLRQERAGSYA